MRKVLPLFSYIFHPIFIPVFGTLFYFLYNENYFDVQQKYLILIQIILITILIPISFFYLLKTMGKVDSIMISELSQRKIPLLIQIVLFFLLIQKSITQERIPELHFFILGGLVSAIMAYLLLFLKIKTSLHLLGTSSLTAFVIGLSFHNQINILYSIAILIFVNGVVASSRLVMKAHSVKELLIGFSVGLLPQVIMWYFWL